MPSKYHNRNFRPQHSYHIFNRGAYKNKIFKDEKDFQIFTDILAYFLKYPRTKYFSYQTLVNKFEVRNFEKEPTLHLISYCLMPNHFHLLLKQLRNATKETNISNLMRRLSITYSLHFKHKYKHTGSLFEGRFKAVTVDTDKQLLYLSKYIHLNPSNLVKKIENYPHSSLPIYLKQTKPVDWLHPEYITKLTKNYKQFLVKTEPSNAKFSSLILD